MYFIVSTSSTITLQGSNQRNAEATPSLLAVPQTTSSIALRSTPQQMSLDELSISSLPMDNNENSSFQEEMAPHNAIKFQQNSYTDNDDKQSYLLNHQAQLNNLTTESPSEMIISETNRHDIFAHNSVSSHHLDPAKNTIDGACATPDFEMRSIFTLTGEDELETKCTSINGGIDTQPNNDQNSRNVKTFDTETDNVVTEYTTVVVGKVFSSGDALKADTHDEDEEETIYASLDHFNEPSQNPISYNQSRLCPQKNSPSQDIQKEFERDFCSVEDALFNGEQIEVKKGSSLNDETTRIVVNELKSSEGIRITLNFEGNSSSALHNLNSELAITSINCQDETDCDFDINHDDVQTSKIDLGPPNRSIRIVGPEIPENASSNEITDAVLSVDQHGDGNAITLEIDTSTSVI